MLKFFTTQNSTHTQNQDKQKVNKRNGTIFIKYIKESSKKYTCDTALVSIGQNRQKWTYPKHGVLLWSRHPNQRNVRRARNWNSRVRTATFTHTNQYSTFAFEKMARQLRKKETNHGRTENTSAIRQYVCLLGGRGIDRDGGGAGVPRHWQLQVSIFTTLFFASSLFNSHRSIRPRCVQQ